MAHLTELYVEIGSKYQSDITVYIWSLSKGFIVIIISVE